MTNKEAAIWLREHIDATPDGTKQSEAIEMAIKALEKQPCEDCISRQAAIDTIESWLSCDDYNKGERNIMRVTQSVLYDLPPVTPQQKMGRWIFDEILDRHYYCSECKSMGVDYWDFCPFCGAKMEVEE